MTDITMVATCLFGLEKALGNEIDGLGLKRVLTMDGRVFFEGKLKDIARANIFLRTAERIYLLVSDGFHANTFEELFEGVKNIKWEDYIDSLGAFPVTGHSIKSNLTSIPACQSIIKKAICVRLGEKYSLKTLPESGVKYPVSFFIFKDVAYLMIDTSGVTLHKRGYRPEANSAPLRETLAAALVMNAKIREDIFLWDPFCGSGTIAIEGCMLALGIAPGRKRSFAGEKFGFISKQSWTNARIEADEKVKYDSTFRARGTDISKECIETAKSNASRAGVIKYIEFYEADARKIVKPIENLKGTLICNPPYGERMMSAGEAEDLYRRIGKTFSEFSPWQIYVLTSCEYFERLYGRKADKKRKLYNGTIPCILYQFYKPQN